MTAVPTLGEIVSEFSELDDATERLEYLIEIGDALPEFPAESRTEANRVQGCQSNVWLVARRPHDAPQQLELLADSDAPMVKGLVAILVSAYSGKLAREILEFPVESLFDRLKLRTFISPMRSNGLHSMVLFVRDLAERTVASGPAVAQAAVAQAADAQAADVQSAAATPAAAAVERAAKHASPVLPFTPQELESLRADFPILSRTFEGGRRLVYLDNAATTQRPRQVLDAMNEAYERYFSNVHRGGHALAAETTEQYELARVRVRDFLHARRTHEIIFTSGTTAAINLVARSWGDANLRAGDEVLLTELEHHSNIVPWQQLAQRTGCILRYAPIADDGRLDLDRWSELLNSRSKMVAVTAVSNVLGVFTPIDELTRRAHAVGAKILVDAAQAAPHQSLDVQQSDVDFLAFSGHKMLGPSGIGVLYGKENELDAMPPFLGGGSMIRTVTLAGFTPAMLPSKFEAGTPPIVEAIGLGAAIEYLSRVGLERIHAHEQRLAACAHAALEPMEGLRILGPKPSHKGGIVTFTLAGAHPDEVAKVLDAHGVAIRAGHHCAMPLHERLGLSASSRASFYLYNTEEEVQRLADALVRARQMFDRRRGQ